MSVIEIAPPVITPEPTTSPLVREEAERLDRLYPEWADRINLETLDLASCEFCVLGQVTGDFSSALERVKKDGYWQSAVYAATSFTDSWRVEIRKRQED